MPFLHGLHDFVIVLAHLNGCHGAHLGGGKIVGIRAVQTSGGAEAVGVSVDGVEIPFEQSGDVVFFANTRVGSTLTVQTV